MNKDIMLLINTIARNPTLSGLWLAGMIGIKNKMLEKVFENCPSDVNEVTIGNLIFYRLSDGIYLDTSSPEAYRVMLDTMRDMK